MQAASDFHDQVIKGLAMVTEDIAHDVVSSSRSAISAPSDESARQPVPPQTEIHGLSAACPAAIAARQASNSAIDCSLAPIVGPLGTLGKVLQFTALDRWLARLAVVAAVLSDEARGWLNHGRALARPGDGSLPRQSNRRVLAHHS